MVLRSEESHAGGLVSFNPIDRKCELQATGLRQIGRRIASQTLLRFVQARAWAVYQVAGWHGEASESINDPSALWLSRSALHDRSEANRKHTRRTKAPSSRHRRRQGSRRSHTAGSASTGAQSKRSERRSAAPPRYENRDVHLVPIMRETELQCIY